MVALGDSSDGPQLARALGEQHLFALLEAGAAARTAVVTPNRRLAHALAARFDRHQAARGKSCWECADILPFGAFVERLYDDALYSEQGGALPGLLSAEEELALWEAQIGRSGAADGLLAIPGTAQLAKEAWALGHAWQLLPRLRHAPLDQDAAAFLEWARRYERRTGEQGLVDRARLPERVARLPEASALRLPARLVAYGFDLLSPQQRAFFGALGQRGVELLETQPAARDGSACRIACLDAGEEIRLAARWARARLEAAGEGPAPSIGIVVPDLAQRRHAIGRVFSQLLNPGAKRGAGAAFNFSAGEQLSEYALVAHAILVLELAAGELPFERVSLLLRSPFLAAAEAERESRARLDAALRRNAPPTLTLDRLLDLMQGEEAAAPVLRERLRALAKFRAIRLLGTQSPRSWGRGFDDALKLLGYPGERALDSTEYQTLAKWHESLARLARLERVRATMAFPETLARLRRMAGAADFQPQSHAVPIQVLGVLEAAGMRFDHLWVMGLTEDAWPLHPPANPFIPFAVQRAAGVPNASPAHGAGLASRLTAGWLRAAPEIVLSHPTRRGDRDLAPSPLIRALPQAMPETARYETWREALFAARALERIPDPGPGVVVRRVRGAGAALLKDQAACPFRAFARHRLGAEALEAPHAGLDPRERGTLVHAMLAALWRELRTLDALNALEEPAFSVLLERAARQAIEAAGRRSHALAGRLAAMELDRLQRLSRGWLEHERRTRGDGPAFRAAALEERRDIAIAGLQLGVRLDRVDETADGRRIVIDYKTSPATLSSILRERPDEPQLPLYLSALEPGAEALAFAQIRAGDMKFVGLASDERLLPGTRTPRQAMKQSGACADWSAQRAFWRSQLEGLAREYAEGRAAVDPRRGFATCRACGLHALCRIGERRLP